MSQNNKKDFWNDIRIDEQLTRKIGAATNDDEVTAILLAAGYDVTAEQLRSSLTDWTDESSRERMLSDAELEAVAGGTMSTKKDAGAAKAPPASLPTPSGGEKKEVKPG